MAVDSAVACSIMLELGKFEPWDNFPDFTVIVEEQEFKCHRFILNATSRFFHALMQSGMKESLENKVTIHGICKEVFSNILHCLYKGENVLTYRNIIQMWYAANLLQIQFLIEQCENFVIDHLIPKSIREPYYHANYLGSSKVVKAVLDVLVKELDIYSDCPLFMHLNPKDILSVVEHRDLDAPSEDSVVDVILAWVSHECAVGEEDWDTPEEGIICDGGEPNLLILSEIYVRPGEAKSKCSDENFDVSNLLASKGFCTPHPEEPCHCTYISRTKRREYLGKLLGACRLSLVSHSCLEKLLSTDAVLESKEAMAVVRQAFMFHLMPPSGYWPTSALHRSASSLDNVVVFFDKLSLIAFSFQRNMSYVISNLPSTDERSVFLSVVDNQIFFAMRSLQSGSPFIMLYAHQAPYSWTQVLKQVSLKHTFVQMEKFVYLVKDYQMCRFSTSSMLVLDDASIEVFCTLPFNSSTVQSMTTVGKNILFFCNVGKLPSCIAFCLNTETKLMRKLSALGGVDGQIVSFKDEQATYLLSENGSLLKFVDTSSKPSIQFMTKLWGFTWGITGALVYRKELFLFGKPNKKIEGISLPCGQAYCPVDDATKKLWPWSTSLPGYFEQIKVVSIESRSKCFPVIVPKKWMSDQSLYPKTA